MSPDELKTLIDGMDWRKILSDRTPYEDLAFRRKECDQRAYPNSLIFCFFFFCAKVCFARGT